MITKKNYCKSELKGMGFNDKMIAELLGECDETRPNPKYRSSAPMQLWRKERVDEVMETEAFAAAMEKRQARRKAAQKAAATKRAKTMERADALIAAIKVPVPDGFTEEERVYEAAVESWASLVRSKAAYLDDPGYADGSDADEYTKQRWAVNFIRHELTGYDWSLYSLRGATGKDDACHDIKCAVLDAIAVTYPFLADECERQKAEKPE